MVVRGTRPYVSALHAMCHKFTGRQRLVKRHASEEAMLAIEVWRVVAVCLALNIESLSVPLFSIINEIPQPDYIIVSDGGTNRVGVGLHTPAGEVLVYFAYRFNFPCDNDMHNFCEYSGYLLGLCLLKMYLGIVPAGLVVTWLNDNVAALSWVEKNKCKSRWAQAAFIAVTWLTLSLCISTKCDWIAGMSMTDMDALSRAQPHNLDPRLEFIPTWSQLRWLDALLDMCNPHGPTTCVELRDCFSAVMEIVRGL